MKQILVLVLVLVSSGSGSGPYNTNRHSYSVTVTVDLPHPRAFVCPTQTEDAISIQIHPVIPGFQLFSIVFYCCWSLSYQT